MSLARRFTDEQRRGGVAMLVSAALHLGMLACALRLAPVKLGPHTHLSDASPIQVTLISWAESRHTEPPASTSNARRNQTTRPAAIPVKELGSNVSQPGGGDAREPKVHPIPVLQAAQQSMPADEITSGAAASRPNGEASTARPLPERAKGADGNGSTTQGPTRKAQPDYAYNPPPDYPLLLREQGVGGVVWLRVWVEADGKPGAIALVRGSGYRLLDESALRAVRLWRFLPAHDGAQALASWVEFPIRFSIQG